MYLWWVWKFDFCRNCRDSLPPKKCRSSFDQHHINSYFFVKDGRRNTGREVGQEREARPFRRILQIFISTRIQILKVGTPQKPRKNPAIFLFFPFWKVYWKPTITKKYFFRRCILDGFEPSIFVEIAGILRKSIFFVTIQSFNDTTTSTYTIQNFHLSQVF
jgi:hypothetical protein